MSTSLEALPTSPRPIGTAPSLSSTSSSASTSEPQEGPQTPYQLLTSSRYDPFLKSLRWNDDPNDGGRPSPLFLLPFHYDRLIAAAGVHNWFYAKSRISYQQLKAQCLDAVGEQQARLGLTGTSAQTSDASFKVRITLSKDGNMVVTASPLPRPFHSDPTRLSLLRSPGSVTYSPDDAIKVYIDSDSTTPSVFTSTKTTFRDMYDNASRRNESYLSLKGDFEAADVLLHNPDGQITETTRFNIAVHRNGKWITPMLSTGCLSGVMRRWLLDKGRIFEDNEGTLTTESLELGEWILLFNGVQGCRLGKLFISP